MLKFKEWLNESLRGETIGCKIINILFYDKRYPELEKEIESYFPIDEINDFKKLYNVSLVISKVLNLDFSSYQIKESETFVSGDNYSLTILNKYFTSTISIKLRMFKFINMGKDKLNEKLIHQLWKEFHLEFIDKTII